MHWVSGLFLVPAAGLLMAAAQPTLTTPADSPRPAPVSVGLAGQGEIDVTRFFLAQGPSDQAISPDGKTIAFVSAVSGEPQVWAVDSAGGAPRQLTFGLGVDGVSWTPDGKAILYGADKGGDERFGYYTVTPDGALEREVVPRSDAFTYGGDFTADRAHFIYATTARDGKSFDMYAAALDGSGSRLVLRGRPGLYPIAAQPAGSLLLAQESRGEDASDVSLVDLATGVERPLFRPAEASSYDAFAWRPDGTGFYLATNQDRQTAALAYYDLKSARMSIVDAPPHDVVSVALSFDGRYLVWRTDELGIEVLHARDLKSGKPMPIPALPLGGYRMDMARNAPVMAITAKGPATPGEIWSWNLATGQAHRVVTATTAGLDMSRLVVPVAVAFKARDGVPLSGLLYMPRDAKARVPVYLRLHGGPSSHARADWKPEVQTLLARGVAVLDFNYRGSTGAGKDLARLNDKRLRVNEVGDLVDAVNWIRQQPGLDGARVAVGGASYGGYLTNAVLGERPDLFVAGVSEVGVADWVRNLQEAAPGLKASDRVEYGNIDDPSDRAFLASISPMNNAAKIKTPLLLQSGANDPRNGVGEHDAFVTAIRAAGGTVQYRRYEGEGHVMHDMANIVDFNRAKAAFLEEYLKLK